MPFRITSIVLISFIFTSFDFIAQKSTVEINEHLKKINRSYGVKSTLLVFNQRKNKLITNDTASFKSLLSPLGTFYLYESLIGLESGIIKDTAEVISVEPLYTDELAVDQSLSTALKHQTKWYFKKMAQSIKVDKMQNWLTLMGYGNKDVSGGIDVFWNDNSLLISPYQQFEFLKRLYYYNLPFSFEHLRFVRNAFESKHIKNKNIYTYKSSINSAGKQLFWYLGYIEYINNTYFVVHCIEGNSKKRNPYFETIQSEILYSSLKELGIVEEDMCGKL